MSLKISSYVHINNDKAVRNNTAFAAGAEHSAEDHYRALQLSYPKFFKMDNLSRWAWLGAEILLTDNGSIIPEGLDKTKVAVTLMSRQGCLEVDKKYNDTLSTVPSPSLFVYTLPNIMLGEISIRHGFKGEQSCVITEAFDTEDMFFIVADLLNNRGMEACICGWADVSGEQKDICLFWITKGQAGIDFTPGNLLQLYHN